MPRTPYRDGVFGLSSTFIFMTFSLPAYSRAISSTTGAMARQGAHQGAQKSISTGVELASTSRSNESSPTGSTSAIHPPRARNDSKRVGVTEGRSAGAPAEGAEAYHARLAGPDLEALLDRLGAAHVHRDRMIAVGDREPALVEGLGGQPEAAVEIDCRAIGYAAELYQAVARARGILARWWRGFRARSAPLVPG